MSYDTASGWFVWMEGDKQMGTRYENFVEHTVKHDITATVKYIRAAGCEVYIMETSRSGVIKPGELE